MKTETKLALTVFLCAALIAAALTIRDMSITGLVTEGINIPPEYSAAPLSTHSDTALTIDLSKYFTDPDGEALTFLATNEDHVNVAVDGSIITFVLARGFIGAVLILAGLLALMSLLAGRERRMLKRWSLPVDALLLICLLLAVWHYLSCKELLLVETIALGVLALFVITLRAADYVAARRLSEESTAPIIEPGEMPEVPSSEEEVPVPEPEEIPVPEPEEALMPEEIPVRVEKPELEKKPEMPPERPGMKKVYVPMLEEVVKKRKQARKVIITSPREQKRRRQLKVRVAPPVLEEEMRDWREVVKRTGKTLRKLDSTLRRLKKKK